MNAPAKIKTATEVFSDRLKELCRTKGSYSEVARDLDINRQQFARYLNGSSRPRDLLVHKMAEYFGVEPQSFFQSHSFSGVPEGEISVSGSPTVAAMVETLSKANGPLVAESDLESGLYMQYKQSFAMPSKIGCLLMSIKRDENNVVRSKRVFSVVAIKNLPSVGVGETATGVFTKNLGSLVQIEFESIAGDLLMSTFKRASIYSLADRVFTGVMLAHGRPDGTGPTAGLNILERIPEKESVLSWARRQGLFNKEEVPEHIRYFLEPRENNDLMKVR